MSASSHFFYHTLTGPRLFLAYISIIALLATYIGLLIYFHILRKILVSTGKTIKELTLKSKMSRSKSEENLLEKLIKKEKKLQLEVGLKKDVYGMG